MTGSERLSLQRFEEIASAYGSVIMRWPEEVRSEALRRSAEAEFADALARAAALDDLLDSWVLPAPAQGLAERIAARAPRRKLALVSQARLWWSGVGLAATLAGAVAGAAAAAAVAPSGLASSEASTVFGDLGGQEI